MNSGLRLVGQFVLGGMVTVVGGEYILEQDDSVLGELRGAAISAVGAVWMAETLRRMEAEVSETDD